MQDELQLKDGLRWFNTPVQYVKGVGPRLSELYRRINIRTLEDLLYHLPFRYLDRRRMSQIRDLEVGKDHCVVGEVYAAGEIWMGRKGKKIFEVIFTDGKGFLSAKWFHYHKKFFQQRFIKGEKFMLFGAVQIFRHEKQMVHPEIQPLKEFFEEEELKQFLGLIPVYSSTEGLHQRQIRNHCSYLLAELSQKTSETVPKNLLERWDLPNLSESFTHIHHPESGDSPELWLEQRSPYHRRLAFEEFFYLQLGLGVRRNKTQTLPGFAHRPRYSTRETLLKRLQFELTSGQWRAVQEISRDMESPRPMNRLLQGDVGSGKTLVALLTCLLAIENQQQAALMVPTEILAEQHARNFQSLLQGMGIEVFLLTSSTSVAERKAILDKINQGIPCLSVGTHALLESDVQWPRLSLAIIDEQHRFGVAQRMKLIHKAIHPDVLVMTATPIPRSLAMTLYGDLDLSLMTEMPPGRQPVITRLMYEKDRPKLYDFIRKKIEEGRQVYFVFPLIEESEKIDLRDATRSFKKLQEVFPEIPMAMLHGRMKNVEKERIMRNFSQGEIKILVSTTVIEVGIDVPNATLMVVEHAERFGLSQLHQLRGRVGRGAHRSYCILATDYRQTEQAKERLEVMVQSSDGFRIAEQDLKIRGPGDFLGTRQSGIPDFRVANLVTDLDLLEKAREAALEILQRDPSLAFLEHRALKTVLEHRWKGRLGLAKVG